jgi:mannose-6-phosphate isomerase-like protein (cupin superfamily)
MAIRKLTINDAVRHDTAALKGWYYQLPEIEGGRSVIYAEVAGDHGERTIGDKPRIYFIIEGEGEFTVNGEKTAAVKGDLIVIPPLATYSYHAVKPILKLVLFMDLIDLGKLPPSIIS